MRKGIEYNFNTLAEFKLNIGASNQTDDLRLDLEARNVLN